MSRPPPYGSGARTALQTQKSDWPSLAWRLFSTFSRLPIEDPTGMLELPEVNGYTVRSIDQYKARRLNLLLDIGGFRQRETSAIDQFNPDWSGSQQSDCEVSATGDVNLTIAHR